MRCIFECQFECNIGWYYWVDVSICLNSEQKIVYVKYLVINGYFQISPLTIPFQQKFPPFYSLSFLFDNLSHRNGKSHVPKLTQQRQFSDNHPQCLTQYSIIKLILLKTLPYKFIILKAQYQYCTKLQKIPLQPNNTKSIIQNYYKIMEQIIPSEDSAPTNQEILHNQDHNISLPISFQNSEELPETNKQDILNNSYPQYSKQEEAAKNTELFYIDEAQRQRINAMVLDEAINQRKRSNFNSIKLYQEKHRTYYHNHTNILIWIETQLSKNIQRIRQLYKEILDYFLFVKEGYKNISKHLSKQGHLGLLISDINSKKTWYSSLREGLTGLLDIKNQTVQSSQRFFHWIDETLIAKLNQAMNSYQNSIQAYVSSIASKKKISQQCFKNFDNKFLLIDKFVNIGEGLGRLDLLHQQLLLSDISKHLKEKIVDWGKMLSQFWQSLQNNESVFMHSIQKNIELFFIQYSKIHKQTQRIAEVKQIWEKLKTQEDTINNYSIEKLLAEDQKQFIKQAINKQILKNIDFQKFVQLHRCQEFIGSLESIIDGLYLKRFSCKIDNNNSDIFVYSTVDGQLVFVIQVNKKPLNKMIIREIVVRRINCSSIQANERQRGFIMNRWNKEVLHFSNSDDLQQFLFSIGKAPEEMIE